MPPPLPNCFGILNEAHFANLVLSINAAASAEELQALINAAFADISMLQSTLESQITFLGPLAAVLTPPGADPGKIVTWITSLIAVLEQMYKPFLTYAEQLIALAAAVATLSAAIAAAASLNGFSITIPSIEVSCTL